MSKKVDRFFHDAKALMKLCCAGYVEEAKFWLEISEGKNAILSA